MNRFRSFNAKWLYPGLGVKRWLLLSLVGTLFLALGFAFIIRGFFPTRNYPPVMRYALLMFLPYRWRALLFGLMGLGMFITGIVKLNQVLLRPFVPAGRNVVEVLYRYQRRGQGTRIVTIGGGHGMSTLLRGLKEYTSNITAVVTVADDGGSSGRLRRELGILPPGDFRNCIAALAETEDLMKALFQYRFAGPSNLGGHSFGNLFIAAMSGVTGSFEKGLEESSRVLAVRGRVLPATLEAVTLCAEVAEYKDGELVGWKHVVGESQIPKSGGRIMRVYLEPDGAHAYPEVLRAILEADIILAGPGSLYTSVLPNLLVRQIVDALWATQAPKVYVANVATQQGETDGYTLGDHVRALHEHIGYDIFQTILYNTNYDPTLPEGIEWVVPGPDDAEMYTLIGADIVDDRTPWRHDPEKLARAIMEYVVPMAEKGEPPPIPVEVPR